MEPKLSLQDKIKNTFSHGKTIVQSDKRLLLLLIICIILLLLFFVAAIAYFSGKTTQTITTSQPPEVGAPSRQSFQPATAKKTIPTRLSLQVRGNKKSFHVGDEIVFLVVGDTGGQAIRGYDAVFRFDKNIVSYASEKDLFPTFAYVIRPRGSWIMISGEQKIESQKDTVLKNRNLMEIRFKAEKAGVAYFPMSFVVDRLSDSNLIDTKSNDILTSVSGVIVQIIQ